MSCPVRFSSFFFPGAAGQLFALYFEPCAKAGRREAVILLPPLLEELNKTRPMLAAQARRFAAGGCGVLLLDLYGTGDSEGDSVDARWDIWTRDLVAGIAWLRQRNAARVHLWAVRGGALLIADLLDVCTGDGSLLTLWQPVHSGRQLVAQWLRLRLASEIGRERAMTTEQLRSLLAESGRLEVAGYELAADLIEALERQSMKEALQARWAGIIWIDIAASADTALPASQRLVEAVRVSGRRILHQTLAGEPFWGTPEIARLPSLLDATTAHFETMRTASSS